MLFLDTEKFVDVIEAIQKKGVDFQTEGRKATGEVSLEEEQVLFTTIPYDRGWKVYIDGEEAEIASFKDAFLSVTVPAGDHTIEFRFLPQGFAIGASLFVGCTLLFIGYVYWLSRKRKQAVSLPMEETNHE